MPTCLYAGCNLQQFYNDLESRYKMLLSCYEDLAKTLMDLRNPLKIKSEEQSELERSVLEWQKIKHLPPVSSELVKRDIEWIKLQELKKRPYKIRWSPS